MPQTDPAVQTFLDGLDHPLKPEIEAVRRILLGVDPAVHEAIKWKSPSFRTTEFFATVNLRAKDGVELVFHTGARKRAPPPDGIRIADPEGLARWLAPDRCLVTLGRDIEARRPAFEAFARAWLAYV